MPAYFTREQQLARKHNTAASYLRLEDSLSRAFLQMGTDPSELEAVKLLFPFIREALWMQVPRKEGFLAHWMYFAFLSGFDLGSHRPELLPELLPDHHLRDCRRRLLQLQRLSGEERATDSALTQAFARVKQEHWPEVPPERLDEVHAEIALKTLRTGFAAATVAQHDAEICDFYGVLPSDVRLKLAQPLWRNWVGAPVDSMGLSLVERLEHPVLKVSRQMYPGQPVQCAAIQGFLREHLRECGVSSENECPASDAELLDWVSSGIDYGRRLQQEQPETVERIFAECDEDRLQGAITVVHKLVELAGSLEPAALVPALKRWHKEVHNEEEPTFYGNAVERVVLFADFAVWIPWGLSHAPKNCRGDPISDGPSVQIELPEQEADAGTSELAS
jgi:hypothetical protein